MARNVDVPKQEEQKPQHQEPKANFQVITFEDLLDLKLDAVMDKLNKIESELSKRPE